MEIERKKLKKLCDKYRDKNALYDVIVPGSGGKDSIYVSQLLKNKYKMKVLSVTWAPHLYTDIGWKTFRAGAKRVSIIFWLHQIIKYTQNLPV